MGVARDTEQSNGTKKEFLVEASNKAPKKANLSQPHNDLCPSGHLPFSFSPQERTGMINRSRCPDSLNPKSNQQPGFSLL